MNNQNQEDKKAADRGLSTRLSDYKKVYSATRNHYAAIKSYCAGNKWLTENAKAVGNWR